LNGCSKNRLYRNAVPLLVAWNEDTVNNYQLILLENKSFSYSIIKKEGDLSKEEGCRGTFILASDSILLSFDKNKNDLQITDYLVREGSGGYLIQYFKNSSDRIFLRIQRRGHRF
jgi:hypothetical protein